MEIYNKPMMPTITCLKNFAESVVVKPITSTFKLIFIRQGSGDLFLDNTTCSLQPGCLVWAVPGNTLRLSVHVELTGYCIDLGASLHQFIQYAPEFIHGANSLQFLLKRGSFLFDPVAAAEVYKMIVKMMGVMGGDQLFQRAILDRYLTIFFVDLIRQFGSKCQEHGLLNHPDVVQRFLALLEQDFSTKKSVTQYASAMFLTPNYLNAVVKKLTGYPASHHIKQRIALEAKRLGAYTDLCMKQVACDLGFNDIPHFSKYFKSATGMNFTDFKQEKYLVAS